MTAYTSGTEFYTSFRTLFGDVNAGSSAATGVWTFYQGSSSTNYTDNNDVSASNAFCALRFTFGSSGALTLTYNNAGNYVNTGLANSSLAQGTAYTIEIIGNNKSSGTINYLYNGASQSVAVQKFDLYVNGVKIGDDLSRAGISTGSPIDSVAFTGVSSTSNAANLFLDDVAVFNAVPAAIGVSQLSPPTLSAAASATVDSPFKVTFADDASWRSAITGITVGGTTLPPAAYSISAGQISFTPSASSLLQSSGSKSIVVAAAGYSNAAVTQTINPGAIASYLATAPTSAVIGIPFTTAVTAKDQYGNTVTTDNGTVVTMSSNSGNMQFDSNGDSTFGDNTKVLVNGTFTISTKNLVAETTSISASDSNLKTGATGNVTVSDATAASDYFRSAGSGNWASPGSWESSHDGTTSWMTATLAPDANANSITIRSGHTITIAAATTADQVVIQSGGVLTASSVLTVSNGPGDDIAIQNGGTWVLGAVPSFASSATANVNTGGVVRVSVSGLTAAGAGVNAANFVYADGAILDYAITTVPSSSGVTFFPNVDGATVPVMRFSSSVTNWGAGTATTVNGVLEVASGVTLSLANAGQKTFRNGIRGAGNLTQASSSGVISISGATAELGGSGTISLTSNGLQIAAGSTTTLSSSKTVLGTGSNIDVAGTLNFASFTLSDSVANSVGISTSGTGTIILGGSLGVQPGAAGANIALNGGANFSAVASTVKFAGAANQTTGTGFPTAIGNLTIANTGSIGSNTVTLGQGVAVSGTLTLTSGVLSSTSVNLPSITNPAVGAISVGSGWVSGPLARTLPTNLSPGSSYLFPVGKAGYDPVELVDAQTTGSSSLASYTAEAFEAASGGTRGVGLSSLNTDRYWSVQAKANSSSLSSAKVRLTNGNPLSVTSRIGNSNSQGGIYNTVGGSASGYTIISASMTNPTGYFAIGDVAQFQLVYVAGSGGTVTGQTPQTVPYGGSGSQVTAVADAGNHYHFVNWSPDGNANPSRTDTNVTADATYTANFALDQFSVLYNANGGTGTTPATGPADYGSTVNLAANGFTRTGYTFTGWNTQSGGGGIHYAEGAAFVIPGSNTTLYAEWSLASVATTTTVAVSPSPTTYGQSATITATVKTAALVPVTLGTVAIYDNAGCSGTVLTSGTPNSSGQITVSTTALGGGIHTITACYTGTTPFTDSTGNTQHTVNKADQTITFGTIQDQTYTSGGYVTFTLPSASSGLQIELASTTPAVCTVPFPHVGQANFVSPGTCTIRASQGGDGNYNAAADVDSTFQILAPTRTLAGIVSYGNAATGTVYIPDATVSASGTPAVTSTTTDASGNYLLSGFGTGSYTISVSKTAQNCLTHNGVMINDASLIAQHTIHMISLTGSALAAANVSDSPQVTAYDASLIAQYVICMSNPDSHAGEWRFSSYTNTIAPTDTHDFSGILKGDVDGDWAATPPPVQSLAANALGMDATRVSVPELAAQQGSQVTVPLRIDNLNGKGVVAYQFDIAYDPSVLGTTPNGRGAATLDGTLSNGLTVLTNSPEPGLLKVAVYGAIPATGGDGVYLKLGFTAQGNAGTTSPLAINAFMLNDARTQVLAQNGSVTVQAASGPAFNGRVLSASGAPIANARIAVRSAGGQLVTMLSNSFGYVYIGGLEPGQSYTMTTTAKGFTFRPVTLSATSGLTQMDIVANP